MVLFSRVRNAGRPHKPMLSKCEDSRDVCPTCVLINCDTAVCCSLLYESYCTRHNQTSSCALFFFLVLYAALVLPTRRMLGYGAISRDGTCSTASPYPSNQSKRPSPLITPPLSSPPGNVSILPGAQSCACPRLFIVTFLVTFFMLVGIRAKCLSPMSVSNVSRFFFALPVRLLAPRLRRKRPAALPWAPSTPQRLRLMLMWWWWPMFVVAVGYHFPDIIIAVS